ncbi:MAG TPA: hypothetical protein VGP72_03050 [Planctomycetota bacterium]|jgi:hypothetical protein
MKFEVELPEEQLEKKFKAALSAEIDALDLRAIVHRAVEELMPQLVRIAVSRALREKIAQDIETLQEEDALEEQRWDEQFEEDVKSGKLDALVKKANQQFEAGRCTKL